MTVTANCLQSMVLFVCVAFVVCGLGSAQIAQRKVGTGLLGSTEEELAKRLGPPDLATTEFQNRNFKGVAPVVKQVYFPCKVKTEDKKTRDVLMAVGFDAKGLARTIKGDDGSGCRNLA